MPENQLPVQIVIKQPDAQAVSRAMSSIAADVEKQGRKMGERMGKAMAESIRKALGGVGGIGGGEKASPTMRLKLDDSHVRAQLKFLSKYHSDWDKAITRDRQIEAKRRASLVKAAEAQAYARSSAGIFEAAGIKGPDARRTEAAAVRTAQAQLNKELAAGSLTLGHYNVLWGETNKKLNLIESGNVRARGSLHKMTAALASLTFELTGAIYGLTAMATAIASPMLFGVNFLRKLEDSKQGMAAILMSMGSINGLTPTFGQALAAAGEQMDIMAKESINLTGQLDEFAATYRAILAPGLAAGMNLEQIRKIAIAGTVAVKTIGLDARQIVQETRDLVAGGIQAASSTLATSLGLTDADIKRAKLSSEGLFAFLEKRLSGFTESAKHRTQTLSGRMEQLVEIITQGFGEASQGAFENLKRILGEVTNAIAIMKDGQFQAFRPEFIETIKGYIDAIDRLMSAVVGVVKVLFEYRDVIIWLIGARVALKLWDLGTIAVVKYTNAILGATTTLKSFTTVSSGGKILGGLFETGGIAKAVGSLKTLVGSLVGIGGIVGLALYGVYTAADYLGFFDTAYDKVKKLKDAADTAATSTLEAQRKQAQTELKRLESGGVTGWELLTRSSVESLKNEQRMIISALDVEIRKRVKKEAFTETTEQIQRMDGALIQARQAMDQLGSGFLKAYADVDKTTSAFAALTRMEEEYIKIQENYKAKKDTLNAKDRTELEKRLVDYEKQIGLTRQAFDIEAKLVRLRTGVATAKGDDRERLEFELDKTEKLISLRAREQALQDTVAAAKGQTRTKTMELTEAELALAKAHRQAVEGMTWEDKVREKFNETLKKANAAAAEFTRTMDGQVKVRELELELAGKSQIEVEVIKMQLAAKEKMVDIEKKYADALKAAKNDSVLKAQAERDRAKAVDEATAAIDRNEASMRRVYAAQREWSYGATEAFNTYNDAAENSAEHARSVWSTAFKGMEEGLTTFVKNGKLDFTSLADSIINDLIRIQIQKTIAGFVGSLFGGPSVSGMISDQTGYTGGAEGVLSGSEWDWFAKGGAFNNGVQAFATGGAFTNSIVSRPTHFRFAKGTALGEMGEAGPEAIMPLTRTTSGDLGVRAVGGGGQTINQVNVEVNVASNGQAQTSVSGTGNAKQLGDLVGQAVQAEILKQKRPGGLLA